MGGAVSWDLMTELEKDEYSPHGRGCIGEKLPVTPASQVFPAWAGLYLASRGRTRENPGIPRMGGAVSEQGAAGTD